MTVKTKYVHTNIIAHDWRRLSRFYQEVFDCRPVSPERNLSGPDMDALTGLTDVQVRGVHLRLPGGGDNGPTLEIFAYAQNEKRPPTAVHRPGFGHIAFLVENVVDTRNAVLAAGGGEIGKIVSFEVRGVGTVTVAYLTDPEGNIVEVQNWSM